MIGAFAMRLISLVHSAIKLPVPNCELLQLCAGRMALLKLCGFGLVDMNYYPSSMFQARYSTTKLNRLITSVHSQWLILSVLIFYKL